MFGVCAPFSGAAQSVTSPRKVAVPDGWIKAVVVTDGAAVYENPNFDSPVQNYLGYQTTLLASKTAVNGAGGLGLFHKVRFNNQYGYVADTDLKIAKGQSKEAAEKPATKKDRPQSKAWDDDRDEQGKAPLYFTRYLGGAAAMVNFTERYSSKKFSDNMLMYGLRYTGPKVLFDGPPLDLNVWFTFQKPGYFSNFTSGSATGFAMFGDLMAMLPLYDHGSWLVTYGFGLMWAYTKYTLPVSIVKIENGVRTTTSVAFDSQDFRIGVDLGLGAGRKIGRGMLRADVKYYFERTQYFGYLLSYQREY